MQQTKKAGNNSAFSMTFFVGMAVYMTIIVVAGFWNTYYGHYLFGQELVRNGLVDIGWEVHLHAGVFMAWMAILICQTVLVARNKTRTHMKVGRVGATIGVLVVILGFYMLYLMELAIMARFDNTWADMPFELFLKVILTDPLYVKMYVFAVLLGLGVYYRTRPEAHKRYMLFATITLMSAAASRLSFLGQGITPDILILSAILPIWIYDWYQNKKIHYATIIGSIISAIYLHYYI